MAIDHHSSKVSNTVTLSLGVASIIPSICSSPRTLLTNADRALYQAKEQGRDRVLAYSNEEQDIMADQSDTILPLKAKESRDFFRL